MKNAFMIAATGSGCGKTTITCALLKVLKDSGQVIRAYKCGPDYIDPMFHKKVLGIPSQNLDLFFSDKQEIRDIFYHRENTDISVVEGVMGVYDGISVDCNEGSSYDLACALDIPIVLVVNARGMGRSLLAVIKGFQAMDEKHLIKAVILNQISPMYYKSISSQIENTLGITVLGYFPKCEDIKLESRYLGLMLPFEIDKLESDIQKAGDIISNSVDMEKLFTVSALDCRALAKQEMAQTAACQINFPIKKQCEKPFRIGIARDEAFCFYYEENLRTLENLGAELIAFSPLRDSRIPDNLDGLILGGGYPELFAKPLSTNGEMLVSIQNALQRGVPSLAECGGFMYLHKGIKVEDKLYPMVGMIDGICEKKERLVRFGYLTIKEKNNSFIPCNTIGIKGHEFHYYDSTNNGCDAIAVKPDNIRTWKAAHISDTHWWGFAHLYYPSNMEFAVSFMDKCKRWRERHR